MITIDVDRGKLQLEVSEAELRRRMTKWVPPVPRYKTGVFAKYANSVSSAAFGAVTTPGTWTRRRRGGRDQCSRFRQGGSTREMSKMRLTGAQIVWKCLEREGVDTVFGYPGGCVLPLYDALQHTPSIHHVLVRHEQGAAHMADGYSRATGKVGVALATSGPGATNLVTGIATAMLDSSPIVCLTGQVGSKFIGTDAFQEIDITGITMPITKHNYMVTDVNDIARTLREAFIIARTGRPGPVLVDITKDAQMASCEFEWESEVPQLRKLETWDAPDPAQLAEAAALINKAERPVILAGHGILMSGAMQDLQLFAEASDLPVGSDAAGTWALCRTSIPCVWA